MTHLVPRSVLYGNPNKFQPEVSPDGTMISFLAPRDGVLNLWIAPVDDFSKAQCITDEKERGLTNYFWTYLPNTIVFTQDNKGDENEVLYKVSIHDQQKIRLAGGPNIRVEIVRIHHHQKDWILIAMNDREPNRMDYYKVNLTSGEHISAYKNGKNYSHLIFDHSFNLRAATLDTKDAEKNVYSFNKSTQDFDLEFTVPFEDTMTTYLIGFGQHQDKILMSESRGRDTGALATFDIQTKKIELLASHPRADLVTIQRNNQTYSVLAAQFEHTQQGWIFLDKDFEDHFASLQKQQEGYLSVVSQSLDNNVWIIKYSPDNATVKFYLYNKLEKKKTFLFDAYPDLNKYKLSKMEPLTLKARDGLELVCYLHRPLNPIKKSGPNPMVLAVHGGPWYRNSHEYNPTLQLFADRGYITLCVNYRASTGLGKTTLNAGNQEWAGKIHTDLIDACQWAIDQKLADPNKIAIYGASYGGYAALVGLTFTPQFFACAVDIVGPSNINTLLETIPPYWEHKINMYKRRIGDFTSKEGQKALYLRSPISRVDSIEKPLLILQGANDPRVKQAESDQIFNAMKEKNIPVSYFVFPDEGHGFVRPQNKIASMALVEKFLAEHLGGRLENIQDEIDQSSALQK